MTTPNKRLHSYEFHHPSTPQQYPSQAEDYISLDVSDTRQQRNYPSYDFKRNLNNRKNQNYRQKQQQFLNKNYTHSANRNRSRCDSNRKINDETDDSYFHISMLEDPWAHLVQRMNAIRNSETSINESGN